jgi:hypothetical protein
VYRHVWWLQNLSLFSNRAMQNTSARGTAFAALQEHVHSVHCLPVLYAWLLGFPRFW